MATAGWNGQLFFLWVLNQWISRAKVQWNLRWAWPSRRAIPFLLFYSHAQRLSSLSLSRSQPTRNKLFNSVLTTSPFQLEGGRLAVTKLSRRERRSRNGANWKKRREKKKKRKEPPYFHAMPVFFWREPIVYTGPTIMSVMSLFLLRRLHPEMSGNIIRLRATISNSFASCACMRWVELGDDSAVE